MSQADAPPPPDGRRALRALGWFWLAVLLLAACGAGVLQYLGPPASRPAMTASRPAATAAAAPVAPATPTASATPAAPAGPALPPLAAPRSTTPEAANAPATQPASPPATAPAILATTTGSKVIPAPQRALEETAADYPGHLLPRIGADRRSPMQAYAAAADLDERRPRIAILVAGIGMSASESEDAIQNLPAAVSLAVSPYAYHPDPLLAQARQRGHEYLVSIPMEPQGYPLDDPGNRALMTGNSDAENLKLLDWALSRFGGYVGATGALGGLRGERFAASTPQMAPVLAELAARGLLYIDPRPGAKRPPDVVGRAIDVVIDAPAVRTEIEAKLARLEQIARDRGSAIGLAGMPRPVTVDRIAAWANTLATRGFALMPVSAVAPLVPPPGPPSAVTLSGAAAP